MTIQAAFTSDRMCLALTGMTVFEFTYNTLTDAQKPNRSVSGAFGGESSGLLPSHINIAAFWSAHEGISPYDVLSFFLRLDRTRCFRWIQFLLRSCYNAGRYLVLPKTTDPLGRRIFREFPEAKRYLHRREHRIQNP